MLGKARTAYGKALTTRNKGARWSAVGDTGQDREKQRQKCSDDLSGENKKLRERIFEKWNGYHQRKI